MTARSSVSREHMVAIGRLGGLVGGKARAAKYTPEQLRHIHANQMRTRFATPQQASEFQRKAAQGRWGVTADERSKLSRTLNERRWGKVAYAKNKEKVDRLYLFLREYISAKRCAPTVVEITRAVHQDANTVKRLLQILERIGRIQRYPWHRGITLGPLRSTQLPADPFGVEEELTGQTSAAVVVPRSTKKCYDCNESAVEGRTRCERHVRLGSAASLRGYYRMRDQKRRAS